MVQSRNSDCLKRLLNLLHVTGTGILLSLTLLLPQLFQPQTVAFAASQPIPAPTHQIGNGPIAPPNVTDKDIAYNNEKQLLSNEYSDVLTGKESSSLFEEHMIAYMQKHNLGNTSNLHNALVTSKLKKASLVASKFQNQSLASLSNCPSLVRSDTIIPSLVCPPVVAGAAQFPEERWSYCADATVATIIVEDSFIWGSSMLTNGNNTISYNPYQTTQPANLALADEDMLAKSYLGNPFPQGADATQTQYALNKFVNGHGGNYAWASGSSNFQNNLITDINQGFDLAGGLYIYDNGSATLTGYSGHGDFDHWIPITYYSGSTTYYADPIYMAPDYTSWAVQGPYASTPTNNLSTILQRDGYLW